jgi:signal transduction histidine kinase
MTVSVVRNHLFEVQIVIRRWGLRVVAVFAGVVGVLGLWRLLVMPRTSPPGWVTAATTGILIAALCVTIAVINRVLQRRLFGARADSDVMIAALSPRTTPVVTDESGLTAVLDALKDALRLAFIHLDLTMPGMTPFSLSRGASQLPDRVNTVVCRKVHVGQLSLAVRPGLQPLGRADERLLEALSHILASSAYNLGLQQVLRRALAQAVTAREEERRRIRREIHDGIGPLLAAALLRTESAMALPSGSPGQTESLLKPHELQKTTLTDIRSLVEGLRPPALDHGGLLGALQQHAELSTVMGAHGPPTVTFEVAGELSMLPAGVEVAAYQDGRAAAKQRDREQEHQAVVGEYHVDVGIEGGVQRQPDERDDQRPRCECCSVWQQGAGTAALSDDGETDAGKEDEGRQGVTGHHLVGLAGRVIAVQRAEDMHRDHPQQRQAASHIDTDHPGARAAGWWNQGWRPWGFVDSLRLTAWAGYDTHANFPLLDWLSGRGRGCSSECWSTPRRWGAKTLQHNPAAA